MKIFLLFELCYKCSAQLDSLEQSRHHRPDVEGHQGREPRVPLAKL